MGDANQIPFVSKLLENQPETLPIHPSVLLFKTGEMVFHDNRRRVRLADVVYQIAAAQRIAIVGNELRPRVIMVVNEFPVVRRKG